MDVERFVVDHLDAARGLFMELGSVRPMGVLLVTRDMDGSLLPEPCIAPVIGEDSESLSRGMKSAARRLRAIASIIIMEAWSAPADPTRPVDEQRGEASKHPDRVEHVMVITETANGVRAWSSAIRRDSEGNGSLDLWQPVPGEMRGLLVGVLPGVN